MHKAPHYITTTLFAGTPSTDYVKNHILNRNHASVIRNNLHNDAISYIYSATVSIGDAIRGLNQKLFTWATVKLYYATFYSCRALLALEDDICVFYIGTKPFIIKAQAGNTPQKKKGQTHKVVLDAFKKQNTVPELLSQEVGFGYDEPLNWLMLKREEANYKIAKFQEPNIPKHFQKLQNYGIRVALNAYLQDTEHIYSFDEDHAILAYPLKMLQYAYKKLQIFKHLNLTSQETSYLCSLFQDKDGPIPEIYKMINS